MADKINSKQKGSKNERELCKLMQQWTGYDFARVPSSGGLRWKDTDNTVGDLICTDKLHGRRFRFAIETKFYKDINFEHLILGNKTTKINQFWEQATEDGKRAKKEPILFMRYNGMPKQTWFVMVDFGFFEVMLEQQIECNYDFFKVVSPYGAARIIMNSNDFIELDYNTLHKQTKQWLKKKYGA
jgi:Holliday junction resolvase